jgi:hypothetical protein
VLHPRRRQSRYSDNICHSSPARWRISRGLLLITGETTIHLSSVSRSCSVPSVRRNRGCLLEGGSKWTCSSEISSARWPHGSFAEDHGARGVAASMVCRRLGGLLRYSCSQGSTVSVYNTYNKWRLCPRDKIPDQMALSSSRNLLRQLHDILVRNHIRRPLEPFPVRQPFLA